MGGAVRSALHDTGDGFPPAPRCCGRARGTLPRARSAELAPALSEQALTGGSESEVR